MDELTSLPLPQEQLPEGKHSSPVLILTSIFLILISLSTAGYLYLQNRDLTSQLSAVSSPAPAVSPDPISNWQTYNSERFGFSFRYPPELTHLYDQSDQYVEKGISNAMILLQNYDGSKPKTESDSDFQIVVYIANKSGEFNLENPQGKQSNKIINGVDVIMTTTTQKLSPVPTAFFQSSPNKIAVQLSIPDSTNREWFDQILSTFKFTDSVSQDDEALVRQKVIDYLVTQGNDRNKLAITSMTKFANRDVYSVGYKPAPEYVGGALWVLIGKVGNNWVIPNSGDATYCSWIKTSGLDEATIAFMGPTCQ